MSNVLYYLSDNYWNSIADPETAEILTGGPKWMIAIISAYLLFILKVGPALMKNRQAFELKLIMQVYNVINISLNVFYVAYAISSPNFINGLTMCDAPHTPTDVFVVMSLYLAMKVLDLLDTVFFVLRKKSPSGINFASCSSLGDAGRCLDICKTFPEDCFLRAFVFELSCSCGYVHLLCNDSCWLQNLPMEEICHFGSVDTVCDHLCTIVGSLSAKLCALLSNSNKFDRTVCCIVFGLLDLLI